MLPHSFLHWWHISTGSGGKGHSAMISGQRCVCVCRVSDRAHASLCVHLCDCAERINALCEKSSSTSTDGFNQVETAAAERKGGKKKGREKKRKTTEKSLNMPKNSEAVSFSAYAKTKLYAEHTIQMYLQHCTVR